MQYVCAKCGNTHYESDQFQATGGNFAKIFDIQNKKFVTVTCTRCGYTELYKQQGSEAWFFGDFWTNSPPLAPVSQKAPFPMGTALSVFPQRQIQFTVPSRRGAGSGCSAP